MKFKSDESVANNWILSLCGDVICNVDRKFIIIFVMNLGDCTITMAEILPFVNEFKVLKDYDLLGLPLPQLG